MLDLLILNQSPPNDQCNLRRRHRMNLFFPKKKIWFPDNNAYDNQ
jgi:hypothetical protein